MRKFKPFSDDVAKGLNEAVRDCARSRDAIQAAVDRCRDLRGEDLRDALSMQIGVANRIILALTASGQWKDPHQGELDNYVAAATGKPARAASADRAKSTT